MWDMGRLRIGLPGPFSYSVNMRPPTPSMATVLVVGVLGAPLFLVAGFRLYPAVTGLLVAGAVAGGAVWWHVRKGEIAAEQAANAPVPGTREDWAVAWIRHRLGREPYDQAEVVRTADALWPAGPTS